MATFCEHSRNQLNEFLSTIEPWSAAYADATFGFIGLKRGAEVDILHGHILLPNAGPVRTPWHFETESVVAGILRLSDIDETYETALQKLTSGPLKTPYGAARILLSDNQSVGSYFHSGFQLDSSQARTCKFALTGAQGIQYPSTDKAILELKAASTPYDSLEELARDASVFGLRRDMSLVEVTASPVVMIDTTRRIVGTRASLGLLMAPHLDFRECGLGYKVVLNGITIDRRRIDGDALTWKEEDTHWTGMVEVAVSEGGILQCFASYAGHVQHQWWIADPDTFPNLFRVLHNVVDPGLDTLRTQLLDEVHFEKYSRDFEGGIANLLFMMGFSVDPIGGALSQRNPDIVATTKAGNVIVVECTTGQLNQNGKLGKLKERAEAIRAHLAKSVVFAQLKVLPVMVTAKKL